MKSPPRPSEPIDETHNPYFRLLVGLMISIAFVAAIAWAQALVLADELQLRQPLPHDHRPPPTEPHGITVTAGAAD